jgi:transposase
MAFTWYGNQTGDEGCNLGSLAVVWPLLERMNVAGIIDRHLPADPQAEFSHGTILNLLVAARLYSPVALGNVAQWAGEAGADILWDMPLEKMNDDRFGRSLERFFDQRHSILASVAMQVAQDFDVSLEELHYDPTHILFHGAYAGSQPRSGPQREDGTVRSDGQLPPAHITTGRRMMDAPSDVVMIHAGLCVAVDQFGGLPIFGHTIDGNHNGHTAVAEQFALLRKHLPLKHLLMISDRGTFSAGHLARLQAEGFHALCSAPWDDYQTLFDAHRARLQWKQASYLSIEQKRRRAANSSLPWEHYELAVLRHQLTDRDSGETIPCRVIFVFSTADQKVARKARQKAVAQIQQGLEKLAPSVAEGRRNTDPVSVARRINKLFGKKSAAKYFHCEMVPLRAAERSKLPAPKRGCRVAQHRLEFRYDAEEAQRDELYDGISVLVTTVPPSQASADVLFTKFKEQNHCELANHQWKTPLAVHPIFLKSPRRVEALVFLMMIALTAYYLLQRMYRQTLPARASVKQRRTTTETILRAFSTYTLILQRNRYGRIVYPTRLSTRQREILVQLGFPTPAQTLCRRLARPPPE